MKQKTLGRTPLKVSEICLGTMTFGEQTDRPDAFAQMDHAIDAGINFFDTAELYAIPPKATTYGATEVIIGEWFKARGTRDKVVLASKIVGRSPIMRWFRDGDEAEINKQQVIEAVDKSLKRLQTDVIDLYQIHWPDRATSGFGSNPTHYQTPKPVIENAVEAQLEAMDHVIKQGKVRYIGLSNESAWGVMKFISEAERLGYPRIASLQNAYHLLNRTFEVNLAEISEREDVSLLAYSPLAQGYLTGKYRNGAMPANSRKVLHNRLQRYEKAGSMEAIEAYAALADKLGVSLTHLALSFVTNRPFMGSNIIGATTLEQLKTVLASQKLIMSDEIVKQIDAIHQVHMNPAP
jgi:aryl-alcohol dehydrogenase-like predicted oxidoreductase